MAVLVGSVIDFKIFCRGREVSISLLHTNQNNILTNIIDYDTL